MLTLVRSETSKKRGILRKTEILPDVVVRPPSLSEHTEFAYSFRDWFTLYHNGLPLLSLFTRLFITFLHLTFFSLFNAFLLYIHCFHHLASLIALSLSLLSAPQMFCCFSISQKTPLCCIYDAIDTVLCFFFLKVVYTSSLSSNWLLLSVSIYAICCLAMHPYALITYKYHKRAIVSLVVRFSLPYNTCWFFHLILGRCLTRVWLLE